jgi:hypothetical protein
MMKLNSVKVLPFFLGALCLAMSSLRAEQPGSTPAATTFESSEAQATLIELFTSEGCSSCPPADAWMSQLKSRGDLWKAIVPVAFHVDYWNHLGWRDRFAKAEFTERQRRYAGTWRSESVYTPSFVVNGGEWRSWFGNRTLPAASSAKIGKLRATLTSGTEVAATFVPESTQPQRLQIHAALLGVNLESDVKRGENSGRRLHHDFVVLQLATGQMIADANRWAGSTSFPKESSGEKPGAFAAWITAGEVGQIIQATGGWLKR